MLLNGQVLGISQDTAKEGSGRLQIVNFSNSVVEGRGENQVQYLKDVKAVQDSTFFFADSAIISNRDLIAVGNVVVMQKDTIQLFGDSLYFDLDSSEMEVYGGVVLKNGNQRLSGEILFYDIDEKIAYYSDTALLEQNNIQLQSRKGRFSVEEKVGYFEEDVILISEDIRLTSSTLTYFTEEEKAVFTSPTRIKTKKEEIYCEAGFYNTKEKKGVFSQNAQYRSKDQEVIGDEIQYDGATNAVKVTGNSTFTTKDGKGYAEDMEYNAETDEMVLTGDASFQDSVNRVEGLRIIHLAEEGDIFVSGNGILTTDDGVLEAYNIEYNKISGIGSAEGNVNWIDSSSHTKLKSDFADFNKSKNYFKAYNFSSRPQLEILMGTDSLYMSSDTILSFESKDTSGNTSRILIGDNDTRIYRHDLQALCDSLVYSSRDSVFNLIRNPVMWSDTTQFTGDTIKLFVKNDRINKMRIIKNSMILNSSDSIFYNQIKGKEVTGFFVENDINNFIVEGNAESVYYVTNDEGKYVSVNKTECSILKFYFNNNKISDVKGYTDVKQKMLPMKSTNHEAIKLDGFKWISDKRPKNIADLIKTLDILPLYN